MRGMSDGPLALVWFRRDLRLDDNSALPAATRRPVLPVFVLGAAGEVRLARRLHHSLATLDDALAARGVRLHLARGRVADAVA